MDKHWIEAARNDHRRVAVTMGGIAAEVNPGEVAPIVVPAYVREPSHLPDTWWLDIEAVPNGVYMSQMYRADEILGLWSETRPVGSG